MRKIVRTSCFLKWVVIGACIALPLLEAGFWITDGYPFAGSYLSGSLPSFDGRAVTWTDLNVLQKFLGFLINIDIL